MTHADTSARGALGPPRLSGEMRTKDEAITVSSDLSEIVVDLRSLQPKLHKRLTTKLRRRQREYIYQETVRLFSP